MSKLIPHLFVPRKYYVGEVVKCDATQCGVVVAYSYGNDDDVHCNRPPEDHMLPAHLQELAAVLPDLQLAAQRFRGAVLAELLQAREHQLDRGYGTQHDVQTHSDGALVLFAAAILQRYSDLTTRLFPDTGWIPAAVGHMSTKWQDNPRQMLVNAMAVILAELERQQSCAEVKKATNG